MTEATPDAPARSRRLSVRFSFTLVAAAFVALMNRALASAVEEYSATLQVPALPVAAYVGFGILSGVAFGLAAMLPHRIPAFHWRRALTLAALPAVVLTLNIVAFASPSTLPGWLLDLSLLFGLQTATVSAVFVGVAVSAAFAET